MSDPKNKIFRELQNITDEMDQMFGQLARQGRPPWGRAWRPNTDVFESADEMIILVELAGVSKDEVQLTLKGNILRLVGERVLYRDKVDMAYRNMEVNFGPFERHIYLHESVDPQSIQAHYKDGFLEIKIQKRPKNAAETREIEIETEE
jgi:HSP20 family protein